MQAPSTCRSTGPHTFVASTSSPAHVKLPAVHPISCSSSESRDLFQLVTAGSGLATGNGDLTSACAGNGESTVEGLVPLRVGAKRIAGMKDLPGGLSSAVWEVHWWEAPSLLWMQTHAPHSQVGCGGKLNTWGGSRAAASTHICCCHGARSLPGPLQD